MRSHMIVLWASSHTNEREIASSVIPRFDNELAPLWWKSQIVKGAPYLEVEPPQAWYYWISLNFRSLVILLQVDFTSGDEPKTVYKVL
jgi:hypothetical protein